MEWSDSEELDAIYLVFFRLGRIHSHKPITRTYFLFGCYSFCRPNRENFILRGCHRVPFVFVFVQSIWFECLEVWHISKMLVWFRTIDFFNILEFLEFFLNHHAWILFWFKCIWRLEFTTVLATLIKFFSVVIWFINIVAN
jgi:hypothetical protein